VHGKIKKVVILEMASISVWEYSVFVSNILNQYFLEASIILVYHPVLLHVWFPVFQGSIMVSPWRPLYCCLKKLGNQVPSGAVSYPTRMDT